MSQAPAPALVLDGVSLVRDGQMIIHGVDWTVLPGERWVVLGTNGSGKTSLVGIASMTVHPSSGTVTVLGETLGCTDVRTLRARIGLASPALADRLRPALTPLEIVVTARHAALEPWWHDYDQVDLDRARSLLGRMGCADLADRRFGVLSSGERQRVLLARTMMTAPGLVLLDEPTAGLDLRGREELVSTLGLMAADPATPPVVLVTHHVEEIPRGFTHVMLLRAGEAQASGAIEETLTADSLSACMGIDVALTCEDRRWSARART